MLVGERGCRYGTATSKQSFTCAVRFPTINLIVIEKAGVCGPAVTYSLSLPIPCSVPGNCNQCLSRDNCTPKKFSLQAALALFYSTSIYKKTKKQMKRSHSAKSRQAIVVVVDVDVDVRMDPLIVPPDTRSLGCSRSQREGATCGHPARKRKHRSSWQHVRPRLCSAELGRSG